MNLSAVSRGGANEELAERGIGQDQLENPNFVNARGIIDDIEENDKVTFELEKGQRGMNAVKVKQAK